MSRALAKIDETAHAKMRFVPRLAAPVFKPAAVYGEAMIRAQVRDMVDRIIREKVAAALGVKP